MIRIRNAQPSDIPQLLEIGGMLHAETRYRSLPLQRTKVEAMLARYLADRRGIYAILIAEQDGVPVGFLFAVVETYWFSDARVANNIAWYVIPKARGSSAAPKLLLAFRRWAMNRGAAEIKIGVSSAHLTERTGRMLTRMGFNMIGGNYSAQLPPPDSQGANNE
ncbi:GNAT family N-acetyltransferase [Chitiniphilus purpureus]|uniref:GNAT family N-acetyltransferase n=1 Tax=Chitiniphilus purpureus TaxID=2981137 RepID=A0ABY6DR50_9NEIS|nr:GNAT family N-acetyltransferase [Chitiniphilus sp. CD1]UXY16842.1 GNAT family N-acetyltransferase [Chitiniphilus sp. CD1]